MAIPHKRGFFLFIKRQQYWLLNKTTWWDATFRFDVAADRADQLPELISTVVESLKGEQGFELYRDYPENKIVKAGGVIFDLDCNLGPLNIQIADQQISFRDSRRLIDQQLFPILERIEKSLGDTPRHYSLRARFGRENNPYISRYLVRMSNRPIISFDCTYRIGKGEDSPLISIHKESVSVVAVTREQFRIAAKNVLALSNP